MKKRMISLIASILFLSTLFGIGVNAIKETTIKENYNKTDENKMYKRHPPHSYDRSEQNWYIKRAKNHHAPSLDEAQKIIENHRAFYLDTSAAENGEKVVYLTFDIGYENENAVKILDVLKEEKVPAAFFVLKHLVNDQTDMVKRMQEDGHLICNHTANHGDMTKMDREGFVRELKSMEQYLLDATGKEMAPFYRPPKGVYNEDNLKWANEMGYHTVFWSLCYADWDNNRQPDPAKSAKLLSDNLHPGAVVLLHPTSKTNATILKDLIISWRADGYTFGTLTELAQKMK